MLFKYLKRNYKVCSVTFFHYYLLKKKIKIYLTVLHLVSL